MYVAEYAAWVSSQEYPYYLEKLENWIEDKKQEAFDKMFVNYKSIHPALAKALAFAALEEETYAVEFAEEVKWDEANMYALLGKSKFCEEEMLKNESWAGV